MHLFLLFCAIERRLVNERLRGQKERCTRRACIMGRRQRNNSEDCGEEDKTFKMKLDETGESGDGGKDKIERR